MTLDHGMTFDLINIQRNPYCIFDPSLVPIGLQFFKGDQITKTNIFHLTCPQMTLDLGAWPLTSLTYEGSPIALMTRVWLQSDFNFSKETPKITQILHFPPNLTSDDSWPWYTTFDLINIQRNSYCIFDPSLAQIRLQLFKEDPNNENQHFPPNLTSDDP